MSSVMSVTSLVDPYAAVAVESCERSSALFVSLVGHLHCRRRRGRMGSVRVLTVFSDRGEADHGHIK
jgi:hypothetical protein